MAKLCSAMATALISPLTLTSRTLSSGSSMFSPPLTRPTPIFLTAFSPLSVVAHSCNCASGRWEWQSSSSSPGAAGFSVEDYEDEEEEEGTYLATK